jgi:hypothetical protein
MNRKTTPLLLLLAACGGASATSQPRVTAVGVPEIRSSDDPCAGPEGSCAAWQTWPAMTAAPFKSEGHQDAWVSVHVEPTHLGAYQAGTGPMPVGTRIVKSNHGGGAKPGEVAMITVMVKMAAGYDPAHGDWFYGVYDAGGTKAKMAGKLEMCQECHDSYEDHDFLGGAPGLWGTPVQ